MKYNKNLNIKIILENFNITDDRFATYDVNGKFEKYVFPKRLIFNKNFNNISYIKQIKILFAIKDTLFKQRNDCYSIDFNLDKEFSELLITYICVCGDNYDTKNFSDLEGYENIINIINCIYKSEDITEDIKFKYFTYNIHERGAGSFVCSILILLTPVVAESLAEFLTDIVIDNTKEYIEQNYLSSYFQNINGEAVIIYIPKHFNIDNFILELKYKLKITDDLNHFNVISVEKLKVNYIAKIIFNYNEYIVNVKESGEILSIDKINNDNLID